MKEMTKDDVEVVKHYLDKANHAVGHAFEAAKALRGLRAVALSAGARNELADGSASAGREVAK